MIGIGGGQDSVHILRVSDYTTITTSLATGHGSVNELDFNEATTNMITCGNTNVTKLY
jgi:hypothetical protein